MKHYDPPFYKVVFFSSAPIGVPFLEQLAKDTRFQVVGVVTAPDKASGRGLEVKSNVINESATRLGIDTILTPTKINPDKSDEGRAFTEQLKALDADFFVVIAYGKIMPQTILDIPKIGPINFHGSLLPKYRGASPMQSALLHNDTMTGITIMHMSEGMDEGDEIAKLAFSIDFSRTMEDLTQKMIQVGPEFLCNTLRDFGKEHLTRKPQDHEHATYATKFTKEDGKVNPREDTLQSIYNKYRAYYVRPKIFFIHNDKRVIIEKLVVDRPDTSGYNTPMVSENNELHSSVVECVVKPEGKKEMSWNEFKRGYIEKN